MRNDELKASTRRAFHSSLIIPHSSLLIYFRQHLAADVLAAGALARHQAARGRDDVDAVAAQDARDLGRAHVDAPSGRGDAREVRDRAGAARVVAQEDADRPLRPLALRDVVVDVALLLEDAGDLQLQLRRRDVHARVLRGDRVAHPRQHVGNRVSHYSNSKESYSYWLLAVSFSPPVRLVRLALSL